MHCVLTAWQNHMSYLGIDLPANSLSHDMYYIIRGVVGCRNEPTWSGIVPAMIEVMSSLIGCQMRVQHRLWTPEHYLADVESDVVAEGVSDQDAIQRMFLMCNSDFGECVSRITLAPAIYLLLNSSHAVFSETVPKGGPIMALQVYKEE